MNDTIYIVLKDTLFSQQQIIDAYRDLIRSQQGTYDTFIFILLGIFAATIAINYYISTRKLRSQIEDVFSEKENEFRKDFKSHIDKSMKEHTEKVEKQFKIVTADQYRSFAVHAAKSDNYDQAFDYLLKAVSIYEGTGYQNLSRMCAEEALSCIPEMGKKNLWEQYFLEIQNRKGLIESVKAFPPYLTKEKQEILKLIPKEDNDINNKT